MTKLKNASNAGVIFAQQAERQIVALSSELKAMSDMVRGLQNAIKAPAPKGGSRYTKRQVSRPSPFLTASLSLIGRGVAGDLLSSAGLNANSVYPSSAQAAASYVSAFQKAQRIL